MDTQPLEGIRVVDMTTLAMGPLAAQILGDYGADVVKVEALKGDPFRDTVPMRNPGMGHVFLQYNRNKRSVAMDLKSPSGHQAFLKLVSSADILISNVRPSGMRRLGFDYDALQQINPALIYCAAYGFSECGPYRGRPAADDTIQAMSGIVALSGRMGVPPAYAPSVIADKAVGLTLANAALAALLKRAKTGLGEYLEIPMFETMVAFVMPEHLAGRTFEPSLGDMGYNRIINPMRKPFRTRDGYICALPYTTEQWLRFFNIICRDDLANDPDLKVAATRNKRIEELYGVIAEAMPSRTTAEWARLLQDADIMFGEVFEPEELLSDPQLEAYGLFTLTEHPTEGPIRMISSPVRSMASAAASPMRFPPPRLGEHSREILAEVGMSEREIAKMVDEGALLDGSARAPGSANLP